VRYPRHFLKKLKDNATQEDADCDQYYWVSLSAWAAQRRSRACLVQWTSLARLFLRDFSPFTGAGAKYPCRAFTTKPLRSRVPSREQSRQVLDSPVLRSLLDDQVWKAQGAFKKKRTATLERAILQRVAARSCDTNSIVRDRIDILRTAKAGRKPISEGAAP
jgi:hypothetical protein